MISCKTILRIVLRHFQNSELLKNMTPMDGGFDVLIPMTPEMCDLVKPKSKYELGFTNFT